MFAWVLHGVCGVVRVMRIVRVMRVVRVVRVVRVMRVVRVARDDLLLIDLRGLERFRQPPDLSLRMIHARGILRVMEVSRFEGTMGYKGY